MRSFIDELRDVIPQSHGSASMLMSSPMKAMTGRWYPNP